MFRRVLVANRGEVAVRVIRACRELGVEAVAVYSTADRDALHTRLADRAVHIGPPPPQDSYLNIPSLVAAGETTGCDAVHPGWGFLAENADFAHACEDMGLVFVGPRPETLELVGDKAAARSFMREAGIPIVPGSDRPTSVEEAIRLTEGMGFPILLKAIAGGGGRGMRKVEAADELEAAFRSAAAEAKAAFSNDSLYVEQALIDPRHVEIQAVGDGEGGVLTLGERDCSVQRRHQKVIEEAPSPAVSSSLRRTMEDACHSACAGLRYRGAGTMEFLLKDDQFFFIELNARLQVEHPVSELLTGVDVVSEQLRVAAGTGLSKTGRAELRGHALEVRINTEDPTRGFLPTPGLLTRFRPPLGPGVRVDTHAYEGYCVPAQYDSLLAKIIVWAEDRPGALARSRRALSEFEVEGVPTTRELGIDILEDERFRNGNYTTGYLRDARPRLSAFV